ELRAGACHGGGYVLCFLGALYFFPAVLRPAGNDGYFPFVYKNFLVRRNYGCRLLVWELLHGVRLALALPGAISCFCCSDPRSNRSLYGACFAFPLLLVRGSIMYIYSDRFL